MAVIGWNEDSPSGASAVGRGPQDIQAQLKAAEQGFSESLEFPAGNIRQGTSRAFVGATSASSYAAASENTNRGRLYYDSSATEVYFYVPMQLQTGSGPATFNVSRSTYLFGSPRYIQHATNPNRGQWVTVSGQSGFANITDSSNLTFSFTSDGIKHGDETANVEFETPPQVYVQSESSHMMVHISTITQGGFAIWAWDNNKTSSPVSSSRGTITWISSGTLTKSYQ